ncbi:MAG: Rieske (2Fe-2S) protein [Proteobacteria bacterium]|nr:Rieske (2Fe-2S) protein [Burkholderiales bacterium]
MDTEAWRKGCDIEELADGARLVEIARRKVVIMKAGDRLFAFNDLCAHSGGPMHRAEVEGTVLTCPLHGWRFDLARDGEELHGFRPLAVYPVRQSGDSVEVFL